MTRDVYRPSEYSQDAVRRSIAKLKSYQDGDVAILEVVACGSQAIPHLRALLFAREPSGLFQIRVRVVDALAKLGAREALIEYLEAQPTILDPIERVGEDAVINAAALAVASVREGRVFELLLRLAQRSVLTGVIGALGAFGRVEAIPVLVDALQEDASRLTAENALKKLGRPARDACCAPPRRKYRASGKASQVCGGGEAPSNCWQK